MAANGSNASASWLALMAMSAKRPRPAPRLQDYTCPTCGLIGQHFQDACPSRSLVGLPEVFRKREHDKAIAEATKTFECPPGYLTGHELLPLIRTRADVPPWLKCVSCAALVDAPVWCEQCDCIACAACMAPPDEQYVCPKCNTRKEKHFHHVGALREIAKAWIHTAVSCIDAKTWLAAGQNPPEPAPLP